ncbi:GGDEF domain-containing protein [Paraburkholderia sp.]|uniref:sensor domain-containing diguanylate cyclase n=1 Tax=Paraburkholderia sp. TaxID=1926495 RepID=UPI002399ADC6|nr:GGDEF domain-containing protein [Paraburkholderia sp.]MDE1184538.1 GGDEF domain-containing protein [Paraburkholderia sp.]
MKSSIMSLSVSRQQAVAATAVAAFIVATVLAVLRFASVPGPTITPFLPMFAMAVLFTEGLTAYLLWTQFMITRQPFLAALGGAYGYTAVAVAIQLPVFPGVFSPTGLLGAGPQSAVLIWAFWHAGTPLLMIAALFVGRCFPAALGPARPARRIGAALFGLPVCASVAVCALAIHGASWLPDLISGGSYKALLTSPTGIAIGILSVTALGYAVVTTRLRTLLDLWLSVALLAGLADVALTMFASSRYSVGWYVARMESVLASSTVLGVLIWEISHLYRELHAANAQLSEFAARDGLTGLYNRRAFDDRYRQALDHAHTNRGALSILMIDIDHFKRYNDTLGHLHGDQCLIAVAHALQGALRRNSDFVARYGGEEFVVVLPDCEHDMAARIGESLRKAVARLAIDGPFTEAGHVTASVGIATFSEASHAPAVDLLAHADAALYRAKAAGRDRVAAWPDASTTTVCATPATPSAQPVERTVATGNAA